jgi:hypothetical protein
MKKTTLHSVILVAAIFCLQGRLVAQEPPGPALSVGLDNVYRLYDVQSRSISPENFSGEPGKGGMATEGTGQGAARDLGQGWKVSPSIQIKGKSTFTLAEMTGPGCVRSIWMTPTGNWRTSILRIYWDDEADPSVEVPIADFFASGCAFTMILKSPSRHWAGNRAGATCRCRTTWRQWRFGISRSRTKNFRPCPVATNWNGIESACQCAA